MRNQSIDERREEVKEKILAMQERNKPALVE